MQLKIFFVFLFALVSSIIYIVASYEKDSKILQYLENKSKNYTNNYYTIYDKYKTISQIIFDTKINTPIVQNIFKDAKHSTDHEKMLIRESLYNELKETYKLLQSVNIKQLHFHLPNNDSFLRFHKPAKFGDNLTKIRETIKYVNETKKKIDGFEEGRIYNGYRFVFPLFMNKNHIGSVEVSFSALAISRGFLENYNLLAVPFISTNVIDKKVFNNEKSNYLSSEIDGYCLETKVISSIQQQSKFTYPKNISRATLQTIQNKAKDNAKNSFSVYDSKLNQTFTFIKINNPITHKHVAMFMIISDANYIVNKTKNFYIILALSNLLAFFILLIVFKEYSHRKKTMLINKQLSKTLQLFDANVISSNTDINGHITYASQALCEISEFSQKELIGRPYSMLRHPDMQKELFSTLWETIRAGKIWQGDIKNKKKNGGYFWVHTIITPEFDKNGNIVGFSSIKRDISAEKAKEQFMANMSHELRTPLNSIIGFSTILNKKLQDPKLLEISQQISTSSKSLLKLINDILDLSKINDDKFSIEPYEFHAFKEAQNHVAEFSILAATQHIEFESNLDASLKGSFLGDWQRIQQIIYNLISNALKFTHENGKITFSLQYENKSLIIRICDNGIGMTPQTQDKIFKPFVQADGSITRKYGGTGLGLSITQKLVEMMQGSIELISQKDEGSTFVVKLPLKKLADDADVKSAQKDIPASEKEKITMHLLIAEDNKTNQMLLSMLLDEFGITYDIANDGEEAVQMFNPISHQLILMDENMPNMSGIEAMHQIRNKHNDKDVIIIALTANAMKGDRERFINMGMNDYISKPIDDEELYAVLQKFSIHFTNL